MFNANPLLRYDGYYVMSDWLEVPNLRVKSTQFFGYLIQEKVLGLEIPVQSYMPKSRRVLFVFYAIASYLYRWVVTFSILFFLYGFLKPHGLGSISALMALGSLIPLLFMPLFQIVKFVRTPGRLRKVKKVRAALSAVAFVAVVTGILLIPTPLRITGTLVLTPAKPSMVYAEVPGRLTDIKIRDGEYVEAGQEIATLSNLDKLREREELMEKQSVNSVKALWYSRADDITSRGQMVQYEQAAKSQEPSIRKIQEQIDSLTLRAPVAGRAIGVPHPETRGQWLKPGKPFCEIADPKQLEAHLIVDQSDFVLISRRGENQAVAWIKIYGTSEITFKSYVSAMATKNKEDIPPELSNQGGGEIATKQDPKTGQAKALTAMYEVTIPIDNKDLLLQPGLRGFAKIDGGTHSLGWWLWRLIVKTFHFTL